MSAVQYTIRVHLADDGEYSHRCGATENGIDWRPIGCRHLSPREAIRHADDLAARSEARAYPQAADEEETGPLSEPPDDAPDGSLPTADLPRPWAATDGGWHGDPR